MFQTKVDPWLTDEGLALLAGWSSDGVPRAEMTRRMGIGHSTLRRWELRHPDIARALAANGMPADYRVEMALLDKALAGDMRAIQFWLKNRRPEQWRDRPEPRPAEGARIVDDV